MKTTTAREIRLRDAGLWGVSVDGARPRFQTSYVLARAWAIGAQDAEPEADVQLRKVKRRKAAPRRERQ